MKIRIFFFFFLLIGCKSPVDLEEDKFKIESLLPDGKWGNKKFIVVVPLENACSSCSLITLQQLVLLPDEYKSSIGVVLTAKSYKLINNMIIDLDLSGFEVFQDGEYKFWKKQLVQRNPKYYYFENQKIVEDGQITTFDIEGFIFAVNSRLK
jgi:hypothetical protein